jgi:hypothetical protein
MTYLPFQVSLQQALLHMKPTNAGEVERISAIYRRLLLHLARARLGTSGPPLVLSKKFESIPQGGKHFYQSLLQALARLPPDPIQERDLEMGRRLLKEVSRSTTLQE